MPRPDPSPKDIEHAASLPPEGVAALLEACQQQYGMIGGTDWDAPPEVVRARFEAMRKMMGDALKEAESRFAPADFSVPG